MRLSHLQSPPSSNYLAHRKRTNAVHKFPWHCLLSHQDYAHKLNDTRYHYPPLSRLCNKGVNAGNRAVWAHRSRSLASATKITSVSVRHTLYTVCGICKWEVDIKKNEEKLPAIFNEPIFHQQQPIKSLNILVYGTTAREMFNNFIHTSRCNRWRRKNVVLNCRTFWRNDRELILQLPPDEVWVKLLRLPFPRIIFASDRYGVRENARITGYYCYTVSKHASVSKFDISKQSGLIFVPETLLFLFYCRLSCSCCLKIELVTNVPWCSHYNFKWTVAVQSSKPWGRLLKGEGRCESWQFTEQNFGDNKNRNPQGPRRLLRKV